MVGATITIDGISTRTTSKFPHQFAHTYLSCILFSMSLVHNNIEAITF